MKRIAFVAIATASLGLAGCNEPAPTEAPAAQEMGEAESMADNAVSLAEDAMDDLAVSDTGLTEEETANASGLSDPPPGSEEDPTDDGNAAN